MVLKPPKLKDNPKIKRITKKKPSKKMEKNENTITKFIKRQNQKNMKTTTTMFSNSKNADGEHPSSDSSEPDRSRVEYTRYKFSVKLNVLC